MIVKGHPVVLVKIGGCCFSDKKVPRSFHSNIMRHLLEQLGKIPVHPVIVHGGGSFGHPIAKEYRIQDGFNKEVDDQRAGFSFTHDAMVDVNQKIMRLLLDAGIPAYPLQSSALFMLESGKIDSSFLEPVVALIERGFVPVLHGDTAIDLTRGIGILSGDTIIVELAEKLPFEQRHLIYLLDVDGLFDKNPNIHHDAELIRSIHIKNGEITFHDSSGEKQLNFSDNAVSGTIDVTGGIEFKLRELSRLTHENMEAFLVNGCKKNTLIDLHAGRLKDYTIVHINTGG
ncbi:acetylglutamate kinase [Candidatus Bathyarchaeota archaeon]|nr:acetylglutamate kinase [Candidatus Bathyarchaeota archaeon]